MILVSALTAESETVWDRMFLKALKDVADAHTPPTGQHSSMNSVLDHRAFYAVRIINAY